MKLLKRITTITLVFVLLSSLSVFAVTEEQAWLRLSSLGVMVGDENGDYRSEDPVTRAEFSAIAARLLFLNAETSESVFSDVSKEHWANGYITQMNAMGIINGLGDGRFAPEDQVTYSQAIKILVGILGYGEKAETRGGYPGGYLAIAGSLGLTKNIGTTAEGVLTRGNVARMVYNALDVQMLFDYGTAEGITLGGFLNNLQDAVKITGVVDETNYTSLLSTVPTIRTNQAKVGGITVECDFELQVGYYAEVYAKQDGGVYTVLNVLYPERKNEVVVADAKHAVFNAGKLEYLDENDESEHYRIEGDAVYIYNGRKIAGFKSINSGTYTMLDNDGNSSADVVFIEETESFVINRVNQDNGMVYFDRSVNFRGRNGISFDFEDEEKFVNLTDVEGNVKQLSELESGNVISVKASEDLCYVEAVVSDKTIEGKIEEIGDDYIVINGEQYERAYANGVQTGADLKILDSGVFSLDAKNRLVGIFGGKNNENYIYGYCMGAQFESGLTGGALIRLINSTAPLKEVKESGGNEVVSYYFQNNDPIVYKCADKLKVNGTQIKQTDLNLSALTDSLMALKLNKDGKITEIYYESATGRGRTNYTFNADIMTFGGENVTRGFVTDKNTTFVCVPQRIRSDSDFMVQVKLTDDQQTCKVYGTVFFADSSYESTLVQPVNVMMIKADMDSSMAPVPTSSDDVCIVGEVSMVMGSIRDDAGSIVYKLSLLNGASLKEEVTASSGTAFDVAQNLRKGDLIRYKKDGFGRINAITKICSVQGLNNDYSNMIYLSSSAETAMFGLIYDTEIDTYDYYSNSFIDKFSLSFAADGGNSQLTSDLKAPKTEGPPVYLYNRSNGWIKPGSLDNVLASSFAGADASKAYVLMFANDVKAIVIIED